MSRRRPSLPILALLLLGLPLGLAGGAQAQNPVAPEAAASAAGTLVADPAAAPDAPADTAAAAPSAPASEPPPPTPNGPPPTAKLTCAPQPVRIAERLTCTLVVDHRPDVSITVTAPADVTREPGGPAEPLPDGNLRSTRTLTMVPRSLKPVHVEGLNVVWQEAGGYTGSLAIDAQRVNVKSLVAGIEGAVFRTFAEPLGKTGEKADEAAIAAFHERHGALPHRVRNWALIIGLGVLGALIVGVLIGFLVKRWLASRVRDTGPWVDPRPAHIIAYEKLDRLVAEDLPGQGETKTFYFRLSEIVRDYLGRRYDFDGLEMTTNEVLRALDAQADAGPKGEAFDAVRDFLDETDLVKFADFAPGDGGDTVLRIARGVIELTRVADLATTAPASTAATTPTPPAAGRGGAA